MSKRQVRIEGDIAYVILTRGYEAVIDAADASLVEGWNWSAVGRDGEVYAQRREKRGGQTKVIWLHRLIYGDPVGLFVDHIDGDKLNNRRSNLRSATRTQNNCNRRVRRDSKSGVKGITPVADGRWRAVIGLDQRRYSLGYFKTAEEARAAYREASAKLHGEFARAS